MTEDFRTQHTEIGCNGVISIDDEGCKLIAERSQKPPQLPQTKSPETPETQSLRDEIAFLKEQLLAKDRQIEALQGQNTQLTTALENTTASLQAAQALHAGTLQQQLIGDGESSPEQPQRKWWQFWK